MPGVDRRAVIKGAAVAAAAAQFSRALSRPATAADGDATELQWLEGSTLDAHADATWGVPWSRGAHRPEQQFRLASADGDDDVPVQTWGTGNRPDCSVKWTAHAIAPDASKSATYRLTAGTPAAPARKVTVTRFAGRVEASTGVITAVFGATGSDTVLRSIRRGTTEIARDGQLVAVRQESVRDGADVERFAGRIEKTEVEQDGPVRAVVRVEGRRRRGGRGCRRSPCGSSPFSESVQRTTPASRPTRPTTRTTRRSPRANSSAQWALAAIQNLALIGDRIPS